MLPRTAKPVQVLTEEHRRAQRIFARLVGGESMRAIAASESLSIRRVQQIVRGRLDRRDANLADDFALLQIARLERALDLIGGQIDAGKPAAAYAYVRILEHLNRLAPDRLRLKAAFQRVGYWRPLASIAHGCQRLTYCPRPRHAQRRASAACSPRSIAVHALTGSHPGPLSPCGATLAIDVKRPIYYTRKARQSL